MSDKNPASIKVSQDIAASEIRYRRLFETAQDGILILDGVTGEINDANPFLTRILGYSREELLGKQLWEIGVFKDKEAAQKAFEVLQSEGYIRYEDLPLETKSGEPIAVEFVSNVYDVNHSKVIQCNIRDISKRKQAEEKVKQTQKALSVLYEQIEERNRQNGVMNELRELLQSCSSIEEMPAIINDTMVNLFPNTEGALFLLNNSRTDLQSVARWGAFPEDIDSNIFKPDECWGLRLGRIHVIEDVKTGPLCPHIKHQPSTGLFCLPLIAKGNILGVLHVRIKPSSAQESSHYSIAEIKETSAVFGMFLSLSIANINLWTKLADQSIRDPLTGLFNRRYMEETLQSEILRAARKRTEIGIVMADIDHFKTFNDTYGHEAGDALIVKLAELFKHKIRGSDVSCRYGGEEFIIILPESSSKDTIKRAEALREEVKNLNIYFREQLLPQITMSMGIAIYPGNGTELKDLMWVADKALFKAKKEGRDRVVSS